MKKRIRMIATLVTMALALTVVSPVASATVKAAKKIKLNKKKVSLVKGKTVKLKVKGTKKKVTWKSSKKKVATVNKKGKVTAKKKGTATITAKVAGKKLKCKVTVKNPKKNKKVTPTPTPTKKPTPNPGEVTTGTQKLKDYILKKGVENADGNPEIVMTEEGMTSRIAYQSESNSFLFRMDGDIDDDADSEVLVDISMVVVPGKAMTKVTEEVDAEAEEGDFYVLCNADIDTKSYTVDKSLDWKIMEFSSDTYSDEVLDEARSMIPELADSTLYAGFVLWETHLSEEVGLTMKEIGFTSFSI